MSFPLFLIYLRCESYLAFSRIKTVFQCVIGKMKSSGDRPFLKMDIHWLDYKVCYSEFILISR